jgi:mono/diheme cytochrome c family protein
VQAANGTTAQLGYVPELHTTSFGPDSAHVFEVYHRVPSLDPETRVRLRRWLQSIGAITIVLLLVIAGYAAYRLSDDTPVTYADVRDHFKHGSTGGERGWKLQFGFGIPYWVWVAMPELFTQYLPDRQAGQGYKAFGMIYEDGADPRFDLPIGMSMRRTMGIDRVYFTCSVCHTGSVRERADGPRTIVLGMPANTFNFGNLAQFLRQSAGDWKFEAAFFMPKIEEVAAARSHRSPRPAGYTPAEFGLVDRLLFRFVGISLMRDQLVSLLGRLSFIDFSLWGPGRVDTFDPPKALLGFRMDHVPASARNGAADFPSVWNQKARKGMWLHWDGNNCSVDERNLSAGFGTGATPPTIDRDGVLRIADWLWDQAQPLPFPAARIDLARAARGEAVYREYCQTCHGTRQAPFRQPGDGSYVGQVTPIERIGTDPLRLDSYTPELAQAQSSLYDGYPSAGEEACREYFENVCKPDQSDADYRRLRAQCWPARFSNFRKTYGYSNMPLDGLWLRAPYLHNGTVPNLRALLEPKARRPPVIYIGYDVYDYDNVGFVASGPDAERHGWRLDTSVPGNGNSGHEGKAYGTELSAADKDALVEYLKTF